MLGQLALSLAPVLGVLVVIFLALLASALVVRRRKRRLAASVGEPETKNSQLAAVEDDSAAFRLRPVLNGSELKVLGTLLHHLADDPHGLHVFAQVPGSAVVAVSGPRGVNGRAFGAIRYKIFDFIVASQSGTPLAAIEYNGAGHYQGDARERDRVKAAACRRAGLPLVVIEEHETPGQWLGRLDAALRDAQ